MGVESGELAGMPESIGLRLEVVGDEVVVSHGSAVLALFGRGDRGMRKYATF